jgi:hypothetical protein
LRFPFANGFAECLFTPKLWDARILSDAEHDELPRGSGRLCLRRNRGARANRHRARNHAGDNRDKRKAFHGLHANANPDARCITVINMKDEVMKLLGEVRWYSPKRPSFLHSSCS